MGTLRKYSKPISNFGASFGIISGELYSINVYGIYTGKTIKDENDVASLEKLMKTLKLKKLQLKLLQKKQMMLLNKHQLTTLTLLDLLKLQQKRHWLMLLLHQSKLLLLKTTCVLQNLLFDSAKKRQAEAQKQLITLS